MRRVLTIVNLFLVGLGVAMGCDEAAPTAVSAQDASVEEGGGTPFPGSQSTGEEGGTTGSGRGYNPEGGEGPSPTVACGQIDSPCDDKDSCTTDDTCLASGICTGTPVLCEDGIVCTDDQCSGGSCVHSVIDGFCLIEGNCWADGDQSPSEGCQVCDSDSQPETWSMGSDEPCDDGDACTYGDTTCGGECSGTPIPCEDNDPCTANSCENGACVFTEIPNCAGEGGETPSCSSDLDCDDGDPCTTDLCDNGTCLQVPISGCGTGNCQNDGQCNDGNDCTTDLCSSGECEQVALNGSPCDDGNVCSAGDVCSAGVCLAGTTQKDTDGDGAVDLSCGGTDCNDGDLSIGPAMAENCGDGVDNDCNQLVDDADPACQNTLPTACAFHGDCATDELCTYWSTFGDYRCSTLCAETANCDEALICGHVPGSANVGACRPPFNPVGAATGAVCGVGADCLSEICAGLCGTLCTDEDSCSAPASTCYPGGDLATGFSGVCLPDNTFPGGIATGQQCQGNGGSCLSGHCDLMETLPKCAPICGSDSDCSFTQECGIILRSSGAIEASMPYDQFGFADKTYDSILGCFTRPSLSSGALGSVCTLPDQCRSNKCLPISKFAGDTNAYCTGFCTSNNDCPADMACLPGVVTVTSNWLALEGQALETKGSVARICKFQ